MTRLLRLFPQFLALEAQLAESASARIVAEDNARLWRARAESAEADKDKAREAETQSLKIVADWIAFVNGMPPVYRVASLPPDKSAGDSFTEPRRRQARDVARELDEEFRKEYAAVIDSEYDRHK